MEDTTTPAGPLALVTATTVLVVGLHLLGGIDGLAVDWGDPMAWANRSPADAVLGAALRSTGLAIGYWILATTTLYAATGLRHRGRRPGWVRVITPPVIRRIVDRSVMAALATSLAIAPLPPALAGEDTQAPSAVVFDASDGIPVPHVIHKPGTPNPAPAEPRRDERLVVELPPPAGPTMAASTQGRPLPAVGATTNDQAAQSHTVRPGDNLWTIAANHVETTAGTSPDGETVTRYWQEVVAANRSTLRSGDPNLIYPGELIALPSWNAAG